MISCTSTAVIRAMDKNNQVDPNVEIYVDRQLLGKGEITYSDSKTVYSKIPFYELKKQGCQIIREKLDIKTNWITTLVGASISGAGLGIMAGAGVRGHLQTFYVVGLPISIIGIIISLWGREYVPIQEQNFQCVKVSE